jgi:hypothetical protein
MRRQAAGRHEGRSSRSPCRITGAVIVTVVLAVGLFNVPGIMVRHGARVPAHSTTAIALPGEVMTGSWLACGSLSPSQEVSFPRADGRQ